MGHKIADQSKRLTNRWVWRLSLGEQIRFCLARHTRIVMQPLEVLAWS